MKSIDTKIRPCYNTKIWKSDCLQPVVNIEKLVVSQSKTFMFYNMNCKVLLQAYSTSRKCLKLKVSVYL